MRSKKASSSRSTPCTTPGSNTRKPRSRRERTRTTVDVSNRTRRRIDSGKVVRAVRTVIGRSRVRTAEVSVAVVDRLTMRRLNRSFLGHDYVTDVLSFLYSANSGREKLSGEIVVCADLAVKMAAGRPWSWHDELLLYVVHGALHLVGYNDGTAAERRRMRAAEQESLSRLGVFAGSGPIVRPGGKSP